MKDKLYLFNLGGLIPYCVIVVLAIIFRVNQLNDIGRCYIGLKRESSFLLLIYDLVINVHTHSCSLTDDRYILLSNFCSRSWDCIHSNMHPIHVWGKSHNALSVFPLPPPSNWSRHRRNFSLEHRKCQCSIRSKRSWNSFCIPPLWPTLTPDLSLLLYRRRSLLRRRSPLYPSLHVRRLNFRGNLRQRRRKWIQPRFPLCLPQPPHFGNLLYGPPD